jgi:uncharacterized protein (DUF4415 family)
MRTGDAARRKNEVARRTDAETEELQALAEQPGERTDTSDIPPLADAQLAGKVRGRFCRPVKRQITARLDVDVLAWLRLGEGLSGTHERHPAPRGWPGGAMARGEP